VHLEADPTDVSVVGFDDIPFGYCPHWPRRFTTKVAAIAGWSHARMFAFETQATRQVILGDASLCGSVHRPMKGTFFVA